MSGKKNWTTYTIMKNTVLITILSLCALSTTVAADSFSISEQKNESVTVAYEGKAIVKLVTRNDKSTKETAHDTYKVFLHVMDPGDSKIENTITKTMETDEINLIKQRMQLMSWNSRRTKSRKVAMHMGEHKISKACIQECEIPTNRKFMIEDYILITSTDINGGTKNKEDTPKQKAKGKGRPKVKAKANTNAQEQN